MLAYGNRANAMKFARANNSDLLRALKHLMETRLNCFKQIISFCHLLIVQLYNCTGEGWISTGDTTLSHSICTYKPYTNVMCSVRAINNVTGDIGNADKPVYTRCDSK